jgi:arginine/lysine/ornithine decarboxylase
LLIAEPSGGDERNQRPTTLLGQPDGSICQQKPQDAWYKRDQIRLPTPELAPSETYHRLVHNQVEQLLLSNVANQAVATVWVPYPPGIPLLMPEENAGPEDGPYLGYLRALQAWDRRFPDSSTTCTA